MSTAVLFAGQAAGDLRAAVRRLGPETPLLARAAAAADVPFERWLRDDLLDETRLAQPVQVALGLTLYARRPPDDPCIFAGHSLGALTAAAAAGALEPTDAVRIAAERGRSMARVAAEHPGGLVAARMDAGTLRAVLGQTWADGRLALAARNGPDRVVLAGPERALRALLTHHPGTRLAADGPWHHPVMAAAAEPLRRALDGRLKTPRHPILCGLDARPLTDPAEIGAALVELLAAPVDWPATCRGIERSAATQIEIFGPGRALRALMRLNAPRLALTHVTEAP